MKKLIAIALILIALPCAAADITATWTHDGLNTVGYTLYFWQTLNPAEVYNKSVVGNTIRSMSLDENYFIPGIEYSFQMTAWNNYKESGRSATALFTRAGDPPVLYVPPEDRYPSILYMAPKNIDGLYIQMPK